MDLIPVLYRKEKAMRCIKRRKGNVGLLILLAAIFALNGLLALLHSVDSGNDSAYTAHAKWQATMVEKSAENLPK